MEERHYNGTIRFSSHGHPYEEFSNFHKCNVEFNGLTLDSSEKHYQNIKAEDIGQPNVAKEIREAPNAKSARNIAKNKLKAHGEWDRKKRNILFNITLVKLECNPDIRNMLMATKGNYLLEATPIKYWGEGANQDGSNEFGKILMDIRDGPYFSTPWPKSSQSTAPKMLQSSRP